jgi:hypothetical protein
MQADKWLEVNLVGLVILGGLMFVTTKVMNLSTAVGQMQANLAATTERVEHLNQALPSLAARVAQEEVSRALRAVVIVGTPEQVDGSYHVDVSVLDTQTSQRWAATVPLASATDLAPLASLAWAGYQLDPQFASFTRMLGYAHSASLDTELPPQINASDSFVLGSASAAEVLAAAGKLGLKPRPAPFNERLFSDWKDLAQALKAHPADFLAPPAAAQQRSVTSGRPIPRTDTRTPPDRTGNR